ncbi:MAG: response regulator [Burkholderiales bacterium]|jgi:CheY-like chemotaxis protein|nr:response regulator [Burkholderiales bacterium]
MPWVYSLTALGQETLSTDASKGNLPQDYRRLLGMIEVGGHEEVIRGRLRRFPDRLIQEWLKELEDLKMLESHEANELDAITFTGQRLPLMPPLTDEDRTRLAKTTVVGGATLLRSGSFLSEDRVANLPPVAKAPADTVVLLVEDDPDQIALAELRLTMAGYQVHSVDRAKALSGYLREKPRPDLLLLDVMLPDGNGFDILAQLRAHAEFSTLPIVMLTVKAELVDIRNGLALGADGYITKPYSKNQLAEVIGRVLKH